MLRKLSADDPRFKALTFKEGLNLVVADVTPKSSETDSRNSAGKSSIVELLHFSWGHGPTLEAWHKNDRSETSCFHWLLIGPG